MFSYLPYKPNLCRPRPDRDCPMGDIPMKPARRQHAEKDIMVYSENHLERLLRVMVKMRNQVNDNEFLWERDHFIDRYYGMQEHYQDIQDSDIRAVDMNKDRDPYYESPDNEVLIGVSHAYLKSLCYLVELDEQLPITDYKGRDRGYLKLEIVPCKDDGQEIIGRYVENPRELIGKTLNCKVKVKSAVGLNRKYVESRCRFRFFGEDADSVTMPVTGNNPKYGYEKMFSFNPVNKQLIDHFEDQALVIEVYGKQSAKRVGGAIPIGPYSLSNEKVESMSHKLSKVDTLLENAKNSKAKSIPVSALRRALAEEEAENDSGGSGKEEKEEPEEGKEKKKKHRSKPQQGGSKKGRSRSKDRRQRD